MATFTNRATLSYNGGVANSNLVTGEIIEPLSATKTATTASYRSGETVTYVVTLLNSGTADVTGVTLTDNLGAYTYGTSNVTPLRVDASTLLYYNNGVLQPRPAITGLAPLILPNLTVPAGGNATLVYSAAVNEYAPLGADGSILNTVTGTVGGVNAFTADETIVNDTSPVLRISKSVSPASVTQNGTLTYTFLLENYGTDAATVDDNVVVADTFDPILNNLSVTLDGIARSTGYNYTPASGLFTTADGLITVPGATVTVAPDGSQTVTPGTATLTVSGTV